jgi:hypothetical protein
MLISHCERFGPWDGDRWQEYLDFIERPQIQEAVTLDLLLCPPLTDSDDEPYPEPEPAQLTTLLPEFPPGDPERHQLLVAFGPYEAEPDAMPEGFAFCGFDLLDDSRGISSLCNCGPYDAELVRFAEAVNRFGLLPHRILANELQDALPEAWGDDEPHAFAEVYAVWRRVG